LKFGTEMVNFRSSATRIVLPFDKRAHSLV